MRRRIVLFYFLLLTTCLMFLYHTTTGDVVVKKDGRQIEGNILSESPEQVSIDVNGVVIYIRRDEVEKIIREKKPKEVMEAEQSLSSGDYKTALTKSVDVLMKYPEFSEPAKQIFFDALRNLQTLGAALLQKEELDEAIQLYLHMLGAIENEYVRTQFFDDQESWILYLKEVKDRLAQSYYKRAQRQMMRGEIELFPAIKQDLLQAIKYYPPESQHAYEIKLLLGELCIGAKEYSSAKEYLEEVANDSPIRAHREKARLLLARLTPRVANPTPVVATTPVPRVLVTPVPIQTPAPQPPKVISYKDLPVWKRFIINVKNKKIFGQAKEFGIRLSQGEYLSYILIPIIIIFLWIVANKYLKSKARKGDIIAASLLKYGKILGPFAIIFFEIKRIKLGGPRKRCPFCGKGIDDIEAYSDLNFYVCPHCQENITPVFELTDYINHLVKNVEKSLHSRGKKKGAIGVDGLPVEKDAMLKLVRSIITYAVRRRASDIHIEQEVDRVKVRARIDGILFDIFVFPKSIANALVSAIKVMANLDITEKRIPQDGQFMIWVDKTDIDVRVASSPAAMGEKISMRLLDISTIQVDSTKLGLEGTNLEKFERAIRKPHGLILVTGPSGSGKTTTLYVALNSINTGEKNIITIEDPIEFHIKGLNQLQVNPAANFTFATGLRSILRQDPDVIMVGEIRDKETAEIAVEAAATGHLVFSTLHTIDSAGAIGRMIDLGIDPKRFVPALICIIAQRLIRLNCPECKKPYKPKKSELEILNIPPEVAREVTYMKGTGCPNCFNSGYYGRIGIFEILMPDESMREILESNVSTSVIRELARKSGMRTLREEGVIKANQGLTTLEEVIRVTS